MKVPIALVFSDLHIANWKQFNPEEYRLFVTLNILGKLHKESKLQGIPLLFCGDLVDHPKHMDNLVMEWLTKIKLNFYGINGNHDLAKQNTYANRNPGYLTHLSYIRFYPGILFVGACVYVPIIPDRTS